MEQNQKILYRGGEGVLEEKKSRFIAALAPVNSEEEAVSFIESQRKKYRDASHHCSAFLIGERNELMRCSDDGEPAQTAGRPMLDVLLGEEIHNACAVVTRYFGGTLLGTGGLVRAYSGAVQEGLKNCTLLERRPAGRFSLTTDYPDLGKLQYLLGEMGIAILNSDYTDRVVLTVLVPSETEEVFKKKLTEGTGGRCVIEALDQVFFGLNGEKIVFL